MLFKRWRRWDVFCFSLIGLAEVLIFFNNPTHFFMGDSLLWMGFRHRSIADFFRGFVTTDPALWYRPLGQRIVESVLYPIVGLDPLPYHVVMFILFFACSIAVFLLTEYLTQSRRAAWLATLFFAPHVTHVFTTYDIAFAAEMVFSLFYVGSVILWVSWLRTKNRIALILSAAFFVGSLLSKETAVALPFLLFVIWLLHPRQDRARLRSLAPHFVILGMYLVFAIGHLHIRAIKFRQLIDRPGTAGQSGYQLVVGRNILDSADKAFTWAFSIPRGPFGGWQPAAPWMVVALKTSRAMICVAALFAMFTPRRKYLVIGLAWFLITVGPTLPLLDHFLPYYLFAPLIGFSLAVGVALDWAYGWCARYKPSLAFALCAALIVMVAGINADAANRVVGSHFLLGGASEVTRNGMNDLRALYPSLPKGTTLVIYDEEEPGLAWMHAQGRLFQLVYGDESIKTEYSSGGVTTSGDDLNSGRALAFKFANGHLVDFTSFVKQRPDLLLPHRVGERYYLDLSQPGVMRVPELRDVTLNVLRAYNGVLETPFQVKLDHQGQGEFDAGKAAGPGTYTFVAVQRAGEPNWVTVSGSIRVQ